MIEVLAFWLGIELDESMDDATRRELLLHSAEATRWRGTRKGLEMALRLTFPDLPLRVETRAVSSSRATRARSPRGGQPLHRLLRHAHPGQAPGRRRARDRGAEAAARGLPAARQGGGEEEDMSACPSCGFENPENRDFCPKCGSYTRWDPTVHVAAVRPAAPDPEQEQTPGQEPEEEPPPILTGVPAAVAEGVIVTVRKAGDESADAPVELTLVPGAQALLTVNVRNQSGIVDNYDLDVRGMPESWWTIDPATVYLVPYGAAGGSYEQEATLRLHPPRSPEAEARLWPIEIVARSRARERTPAAPRAAITLEPYSEIESELRPEIASGRRGAEFAIAVRNVANAPVNVAVGALDNEDACRFKFDKPQLSAPPGRRDGTPFHVRPPKQMIFGRTKERRFTVTAQVDRQRRRGPPAARGVPPAAVDPGLGAADRADPDRGRRGRLALRPNDTTVPDLTGAKLFAAQQKLSDAGLKLGPQQTQETSKAPPGTIINTIPAAGKKIGKGKEVTVLIAVGSGKVTVPTVVGLTFQAADNRLRKQGPADRPLRAEARRSEQGDRGGPDARIRREGGQGQRRRPRHRPVTPRDGLDWHTDDGQQEHGGSSTGSRTSLPATVPPLVGLTAGAAINALGCGLQDDQAAGLQQRRGRGQGRERRSAGGHEAHAGTEGDAARLAGAGAAHRILAQQPDLRHERRGQAARRPAGRERRDDEEPAWNDKGNLIAYRQVNSDNTSSIWVVDPAKPQSAHPVTGDGFIDRRPVFSPNGRVIAFVRASPSRPTLPPVLQARVLDGPHSGVRTRRRHQRRAAVLGARRPGHLRDRAKGSQGRGPDRSRPLHLAAPELAQAVRLELPRRDQRRHARTQVRRRRALHRLVARQKDARDQRQLGHAVLPPRARAGEERRALGQAQGRAAGALLRHQLPPRRDSCSSSSNPTAATPSRASSPSTWRHSNYTRCRAASTPPGRPPSSG